MPPFAVPYGPRPDQPDVERVRHDGDDRAAAALLAHHLRRRQCAVDRAEQVRLQREHPVVGGQVEHAAAAVGAGVGDHDVDAAERVDGLGDEPLRCLLGADGLAVGDGAAAVGDDRRGDALGPDRIEVVDDDRCALGGERPRIRLAQAPPGSGDDRDLSCNCPSPHGRRVYQPVHRGLRVDDRSGSVLSL